MRNLVRNHCSIFPSMNLQKSISNFSRTIQQSKPVSLVCRLREALQALYCNPLPPLQGNQLSPLLQLCIDFNAKEEGISLQNYLLSNGYSSDLHLDTKFIIFYSRFGDVATARKVFDKMTERSVVSWTAMISGYSQNGYPENALDMFSSMRRSGFSANEFTYGSTLKACTGVGCIGTGEQVQGCLEKSGFEGNLFVQSAILDLHLKCGLVEDAWHLFGRMKERDVVSWNSVIGGYAVRGLGEHAFGLFCSLLTDGLLPDQFTLASVLRACASTKSLLNVNKIHAFVVKLGYWSHCVVSGSLIDAYGKCKNMHSARLVYESALKHDIISYTALINGYSLERHSNGEALELFSDIDRMGLRVDDVILCCMINICANVALLSSGRQIHARALKSQPNHDVALGNALIDMYGKSGELDDAHRAFNEMPNKDVISWTSLIIGYGKHGTGEGAITLFEEMEAAGVKPNDVTYLSLLFACSHSGLTTKGLKFFNSMVSNHGIHPRAEHYSCVVDLLARGGLLEEAHDLACKMIQMNVKPNTSLWGALLGSCRIQGNTFLGEISAGNLFSLDPELSVNYIVLANIYAAAGLWENAWKTRKAAEQKSVKKIAGYSLV